MSAAAGQASDLSYLGLAVEVSRFHAMAGFGTKTWSRH